MEEGNRRGRFLDVSEYVLKEFSPVTRAINSDFRSQERNYHLQRYTPQIAPIDHDASNMKITPFLNGLIELTDSQLEQFILDAPQNLALQPKSREKHRGDSIRSRHRSNSLVLFHFENQLLDIVQEEDFEFNSAGQSSSLHPDFDDDEDDQEQSLSYPSEDHPPTFDQNQLTIQKQYKQKIQKYAKDPKMNLIKDIKRISEHKQMSEEQRLEKLKTIIETVIVDFEIPCFESAWQEAGQTFAEKMDIICRGIDQNFDRKIGELNFEGRRLKLLRYLQKKRLRKWRKKVSYDCRKKVADSRLRIKGKFVTREQVCEQLGIVDIDNYTGDEIKVLLERKTETTGKEKSISQ